MEPFYINNNLNRSILFVTAYKDIGRSKWTHYQRDNKTYFENFKKLVDNLNYPIVAYVENKNKFLIPKSSNLTLEDFDKVDTFYKKYLDIENKIIESEEYKSLIPEHRKNNPEHVYASYNLVNHSKINILKDASEKNPGYTHYCWIDFGCINDLSIVPSRIDASKLNKTILLQCLKDPQNTNYSVKDMLKSDEIFIPGGMFIVPKELINSFEIIYESELKSCHEIGISDDDQNILYQISSKNPEIISRIMVGEWSSLFKNYLNSNVKIVNFDGIDINQETELCQIMKRNGSDKSTTHNFTRLYHHIFKNLRNNVKNIFELGIGTTNPDIKNNMGKNGVPGASLRGWREYFPRSQVYGADIDRDILIKEDRIQTIYCNQMSQKSISYMWSQIDDSIKFDLIIDDGLENIEGKHSFLYTSINRLSRQGVFITEDIPNHQLEDYKKIISILNVNYRNLEFNLITIPYDGNNYNNNIFAIYYK